MISRLLKAAAVVGAVMFALSGCSVQPDFAPEIISTYDIHYTIERDGTVHGVETIVYNFGSAPEKHGIEWLRAVRFRTDVRGQDRVYRYSNITVSSPSGASDLFSTSLKNDLRVRVGNQNALVNGQETYVIEYDLKGALNRVALPDGSFSQELYWNATGNYWDPQIYNATVTVESPSKIDSVSCYSGVEGSTNPCISAKGDGSTATFSQDYLFTEEGLTIVVSWPDGTFTNTDPILEPMLAYDAEPLVAGSNNGPNPFWNPLHWGTGLALLFGLPLAFQLLVVARRRDRKYLGVTPGQIPSNPATAEVGPAPKDETIVVQYQPPKGLPVGAAGTVLNKVRKNSDITVTLIDLAVRGYLRIEEVKDGNPFSAKDYRLVATPERAAAKKAASLPNGPGAAELLPFEVMLLDKLFHGEAVSVSLSTIKNTFAADMQAITKALDTWIEHRNYFLDKINGIHPLISWGSFFGVAALFLSSFFNGIGVLVGVGLLAGSFLTQASAKKAVRRSALGHAVYVQLAGFKEYIATAEADRIRFDEGDDIFSRYLPWAMVFGEAERWAKVFAELVAQGKVQETPDWYVGTTGFQAGRLAGAVASISSIGTAVGTFTSLATTSFTSTPGSSGGSGGGGGGGSSGGGGGGGGGGSW